MRIGIGLPTTLAVPTPAVLRSWARAADRGPFACLGVHDRLAYPSLEPLTSLAAVALLTSRIRLAALVVIGPLRNPALLVKQAATVAALSHGRLVLGLGVGPRRDDYAAAAVPWTARGRRLEEQLRCLASASWPSTTEAPSPGRPTERGPGAAGGLRPELLVGGLADQALLRVARHADGWVHGGGPPRAFRSAADRVRIAWSDAGRPGRPRLWGLGYFALGAGAPARGAVTLREYYRFVGAAAERLVAGLLTTPDMIRAYASGYAEAGCDDLVLFPTVPELDQLDQLAETVAGAGG